MFPFESKIKPKWLRKKVRGPIAIQEPIQDLGAIAALLKQLAPPEPPYLQWLTVPHGSELRVIAYTTLATRHGTFLMSASLKQMREKLDPQMFWQIHRSVVVNVGAIDTIYRSFRGALEVKLKDRSELLPVSAAHTHLFKDSFRP